MNPKAKPTEDTRIIEILNVILQLQSGNLSVRGQPSERCDALDRIITELNTLAEALAAPTVSKEHINNMIDREQVGTTLNESEKRRHLAAEAVAESEKKYRNLFDTMTQGVVYQDVDGEIISANPAAEQILGLTLDQMQSRTSTDPLWKAIHEDGTDFPGDTHPAMVALQTGNQVRNTIMGVFNPIKEAYTWINVNAVPQFKSGAVKPYQVYTTFEDITERKQAVEDLRQQFRRNEQILQTTMDGYILADTNGKLIDVNRAYCEMVQYSREELVKMNIRELEVQSSSEEVERRIRQMVEQGHDRFVTKHKCKDGDVIDLEVSIVIMEPDTTPLVAAFVRDITEHIRANEALQESEARFRATFENAAIGVAQVDMDGMPVQSNRALQQMLGYDGEELSNMIFTEFTHPDDVTRDLTLYRELMEGKRNYYQMEKRYIRKDGRLVWGHLTVSLVRDRNDQPLFGIGMVEDITERKQLEGQLLQARKMETIGRLAGGVAHDFNNLLTAILGNTELGLGETSSREETHEKFADIRKAALRAADLTGQLLTFSRRQILEKKHLDLNTTIEDLLRMLKRILGEDIELDINLSAELTTVFADTGQVQQILMNIFTNARDAMPEGGKLTLETRNVGANELENLPDFGHESTSYIEIKITDTGIGMDKETQSHMFEPFYTTKERGKRVGLGLSVVYGITKQHGGYISAESQVDKGCTFKIYFPVVLDVEPIEEDSKTTSEVQGGDETILLVEDDETVLNVAVRILNGLNYRVLVAKDGVEAMDMFESETDKVDLVIMDVVMPQESGPDIYKKMSILRPRLPILFVTGYDVEEKLSDIHSESEAAPIAFLQKPYTIETLGQKIRELLEKTVNTA
jgi:PAS domain S-box-containing protein